MTCLHRQVFCLLGIAFLALAASHNVSAQTETAEPLRLEVPCAVGTPNDLMARAIAQALAENLHRPINVENVKSVAGESDDRAAMPVDGHSVLFRLGDCPDADKGSQTVTSKLK